MSAIKDVVDTLWGGLSERSKSNISAGACRSEDDDHRPTRELTGDHEMTAHRQREPIPITAIC